MASNTQIWGGNTGGPAACGVARSEASVGRDWATSTARQHPIRRRACGLVCSGWSALRCVASKLKKNSDFGDAGTLCARGPEG